MLFVLEATGGYEYTSLDYLSRYEVDISVVNPRLVRRYAQAKGILAKTDKLDAAILADYGKNIQPEVREQITQQSRAFLAQVTRRKQLVDLLHQERCRLQSPAFALMESSIKKIIKAIEKELYYVETQMKKLVEDNEEWRHAVTLLKSIKGVGNVVAFEMIAGLPELGTVSSGQIAALVGVAPFNRDSGALCGKRCIWGGRAAVRRLLYMDTLSGHKI